MYADKGRKLADRLWEETMEELSFAGVSKIIQDLGRP